MELKPLPIGNQTFRDVINGRNLYVDKTKWIYELIRNPKGVYFLSRPRRFGKSLLISTLDEIFQGNKELFKGLWLYDSPYQWQTHPVIRIDFSLKQVGDAHELEQIIPWYLELQAQQHHIQLEGGDYIQQFANLILQLASQNQVVILIDEYDKPLLDNIEDSAEAQRIQNVLKGFYSVIKAMDAHVRFVLLTGISKFSRVGVFSGLNNLNDISMNNQYSAMLGMTQEELEQGFSDYLRLFAEERNMTLPVLTEQIQAWYNGFCFSRRCQPVYNPFSLLLLFQEREFKNYWFESGTPTFLLKLLKTQNYDVQQLEMLRVPELAFSAYDIEHLEIIPLLFQTGYLTIKGYNPKNRRYDLSYPNYEVEHAFLAYLLGTFAEVTKSTATNYLGYLIDALQDAEWERFFHVLNSFLATIDYSLHIRQEKYYQTIFYLIFKLIGLEINAEVRTNQGRMDAVIETDEAVFIFEFKLEGSAAEALAQIREKAYFTPYLLREKAVYLAGVNFDMEARNVAEWVVELMGDTAV
jgi:hypothetical protein